MKTNRLKNITIDVIIAVLIFILIILNGCAGSSKEEVKDGDFTIELLFEKDGYKMYRFKDAGRYIYWAVPQNKTGDTRVQNDYTTGGKHKKTIELESITSKKPI